MESPVTTVLFDLDETLCEQPRSAADRLAAAFERADVEPFFTVEEYHREVDAIGGTASDVRRRERCFERLARRHGLDGNVGLRVADAYEALTDYTAVQFRPGAERVLDAFAGRYRLGLVTNGGPDTQSPKIDALGVREAFETTVLAGYETAAKPDPEPFRRAVAALDATEAETVYVGNSLSADVAGAAACGIRAVWTPYGEPSAPPREATPDYTVQSLGELLPPPWEGGHD